jgi:SAM-dependent methyltransferase
VRRNRFLNLARDLAHALRRARAYPKVRIGQFSSTRPLSGGSGYDRGTPIDRYYIGMFLSAHADDIRGRVLEVGDDSYSRQFGGGRVSQQEVLHVDQDNGAATIVGDLSAAAVLPEQAFDCIILTQTLQYVFDLPAALRQIRQSLSAGGVALITVPGLAPISPDAWRHSYYWRFTVPSLRRLLADAFGPTDITIEPFGNLYAATHFIHGAACQEASKKKLAAKEPEFAVVIAARVATS